MNSKHKAVVLWLFTGCFLVASMVIIGGITRLTHSGLSMVDWNLFMGAIPPLNESEWIESFNKYQQFPEFKLKHSYFTLEDYKSIFFWEYLHRLIGRVIGLVFLVPFIVFWIKGYFNKKTLKHLSIIFILGGLQGFLGWFMVKSGLVNNPDVSHYRLAIHLIAAFTLYCCIFWVALTLIFPKNKNLNITLNSSKKLGLYLLLSTITQIIYGAFVAGLKAGFIYNTWPKMGDSWIAESVFYMFGEEGIISLTNNMATVQLIHRTIALMVFFLITYIFAKHRVLVLNKYQRQSINYLLFIVTLQFILGVLTLIYAVPISLGVFHQIGALALLSGIIYFIFHFQKDYSTE